MSAERLARAVRELTDRNDGWPPTQRDLAVELNVGVGTVNAWAKKAEAAGLVERGGARGSQLRVKKRQSALVRAAMSGWSDPETGKWRTFRGRS